MLILWIATSFSWFHSSCWTQVWWFNKVYKKYVHFQISDIKTGFLYDENVNPNEPNYYNSYDRRRRGVLAILDWSTLSFSEQKLTELVEVAGYESLYPACTIIKGDTDDLNIALTRGLNTKGIDLIKIKTVNPSATRCKFHQYFTRTFLTIFLHQKNSNPKHNFVIFGTKILGQNCELKLLMKSTLENYLLTSYQWRGRNRIQD